MEQNQQTKKIFIVNDDKLLLDMYELEFKENGFEVIPAFGSIDAIEKLRGGIVPDVVLLDVTAPVMDSFELLGIFRSEKLVPHAKVMILSNVNLPTTDERSRALGVSGYVLKTATTPTQVVQDVMDILNTIESSAE